jgi:predicted outer membrane repeat protein
VQIRRFFFARSTPPAVATALILCPLLFCLFFCLCPAPTLASPVPAAQMEQVCRNWIAYLVDQTGGWNQDPSPVITDQHDMLQSDTLLARSFNLSSGGHVLVAAWSELSPIQEYSEQCVLDPSLLPEVTEFFRVRLSGQLRLVRAAESGTAASPSIPGLSSAEITSQVERNTAEWSRFLLSDAQFEQALRLGGLPELRGAGPLLTSSWHQRAPYNNFCPMGDGGLSVVGCAGLAVAQVMRFHAWPPVGAGSESYLWNGDQSCGHNVGGGTLSAAFTDSYDWANIPDNCVSGCTQTAQNAVAELCYELGVAVRADYGYCATPIGENALIEALSSHFSYDPSIVLEHRNQHTAQEWFDLMRSEIDLGRPMPYTVPGHMIVCDGWREYAGQNQIHINWGNGGSYTGWYEVDHLPNVPDPAADLFMRGVRPRCRILPDGTGDFATIQAAMNGLRTGGLINLAPGVFLGPGNRDLDPHGKPFTIRSEEGNAAECVIDCQGAPGAPRRAFWFHTAESSQTSVENLTIRNGYAVDGGGVLIEGSAAPSIRSVIFLNNVATGGGGGLCLRSASAEVNGCTFAGNRAAEGGAVRVQSAVLPISQSTFYGNQATGSGGSVHAAEASTVTMTNCLVGFGQGGAAVACAGSGAANLTCCDLFGNAGGDWTGCVAGQAAAAGNLSADPLFCDASLNDFHLDVSSPCRPGFNPSCGLIGAWPVVCGLSAVIHVRPDGYGEVPTIQRAIDLASARNEILLADGTYRGPGNRDIDFHGKPLSLRSENGNPAACVIDCQGADGDPHRGFYFHSGEDSASSVTDITIENGWANSEPGFYAGGGILCRNSTPVIRRCVLRNNQAQAGGSMRGYGGGVALISSPVALTDCSFLQNQAERRGGGAFCTGGQPSFVGCDFGGNAVDHFGGALACEGNAVVSLAACTFSGNRALPNGDGGALYCTACTVTAEDCAFDENGARGGGALAGTSSATTTFARCTMTHNVAESVGGAISSQGPVNLSQCTLLGNVSPTGSGFTVLPGSVLRADNTIIAFGRGVAVEYWVPDDCPVFSCSDIFGNIGGDWTDCIAGQLGVDGNIEIDPLFCDTTGVELLLSPGSPCAPHSAAHPECDLTGAWPVGCEGSSVDEQAVLPAALFLARVEPNPSSGAIRLRYAIPAGRGDSHPIGGTSRHGVLPVRLTVHDVAGRTVRTLLDGSALPGQSEMIWDGRDQRGSCVSAGLYYLRLQCGSEVRSRAVVVAR